MSERSARLSPGRGLLSGSLTLVLLVLLWQLCSRRLPSLQFVASPTEIAGGQQELWRSGLLLPPLIHTLGVVGFSWAISLVAGLMLGAVLGLNGRLSRWSTPSIEVARMVPVVAFVPLAVLLFGTSAKAEILIVGYAAFWPVLVASKSAVENISKHMLEAAGQFGLGRIRTLFSVVLPAAAPSMLVGARLSAGLALAVAIVTEMVGNPAGLGFGIVTAQGAVQPELMWAYVVIVAALGVAVNALVSGIGNTLPGIKGRGVRR
ncbi:ABC transporter permease [Streptomyces sp. NPDC055105]|uniref:ABC transporter permease n=1 Tax=Streptomyces sp. NPDC055105 TaxID=3365719 RepID=UPI0037D6B4AB